VHITPDLLSLVAIDMAGSFPHNGQLRELKPATPAPGDEPSRGFWSSLRIFCCCGSEVEPPPSDTLLLDNTSNADGLVSPSSVSPASRGQHPAIPSTHLPGASSSATPHPFPLKSTNPPSRHLQDSAEETYKSSKPASVHGGSFNHAGDSSPVTPTAYGPTNHKISPSEALAELNKINGKVISMAKHGSRDSSKTLSSKSPDNVHRASSTDQGLSGEEGQ